MKRIIIALIFCVLGGASLPAQEGGAAAAPADAAQAVKTTAAAAIASGQAQAPRPPDFLEHLVDATLELFDVRSSGNTATHYTIAALFLIGAYVLRRVVTTFIFGFVRRLARRTRSTLDDELSVTLEAPIATFIVILGAVAALKVLKFSVQTDAVFKYASTVAFSLTLFWFFLRAFNTTLDHLANVARSRQLGIAAFMPWIKKSLVTIFVVFGVLMVAQSLGANVKAFLAGLGLGGLAFALAAQDTLGNLFGSIVVAIDQPFRIGDFVQIGANTGVVEDIGLRSTKIRKVDKALVSIPNKTVAAEIITNLSRINQRRVEQTLGLTYDTTADQLEAVMAEIRELISKEKEVDPASVLVTFQNFGASSLDILVVYLTVDASVPVLQLKERLNLAFMRAIAARGLSFAFPTQTVQLDGPVARALAGAASSAPIAREK